MPCGYDLGTNFFHTSDLIRIFSRWRFLWLDGVQIALRVFGRKKAKSSGMNAIVLNPVNKNNKQSVMST